MGKPTVEPQVKGQFMLSVCPRMDTYLHCERAFASVHTTAGVAYMDTLYTWSCQKQDTVTQTSLSTECNKEIYTNNHVQTMLQQQTYQVYNM